MLVTVEEATALRPLSAQIADAALRLRREVAGLYPIGRIAAALALACRHLSSSEDRVAEATLSAIARATGWSEGLVQASIAALCAPLGDPNRLAAFARETSPRGQLIGFVMPGNIPGAGLHELIATLLSGHAAFVKTSSSEPFFFAGLAHLLTVIDPHLGARVAVFNWSRLDCDSTAALGAACDALVVLGDDPTVQTMAAVGPSPNRISDGFVAGFGARVSAVVLTANGLRGNAIEQSAAGVARDVALFEQRGCLSPHHVFVEDPAGDLAHDFAARLSDHLAQLAAGPLPAPCALPLEAAAAIRRLREQARWRAIGGAKVRLWEGPLPGWTVIYDDLGEFRISPGYRTVAVSCFNDAPDLKRRLAPVAGRLEACAIAPAPDAPSTTAITRVVREAGATYLCGPGQMQSPPLDWPHGGGVFLRRLRGEHE